MKGTIHLIRFSLASICALACTIQVASAAARDELPLSGKVKWTKGPSTVNVGSYATIEVPQDYLFTDGPGARAMLEAMGNIPGGSELGLFAPASLEWFAIFRFADEGYVKDDDKNKLDADKLLAAIKKGTEADNAERKSRGWPTLRIVGWDQKPAYDSESHNLTWAIRVESDRGQSVNYNTRLLGRKGIMSVNLVADPEKLSGTLPEFKQLLTKYDFQPGQRYAEYRQGDKIAKYGLTALVLGGAAAAGAKLGLFAWLAVALKKAWKLIVIAVVAIVGFFKRLVLGRDKTTQ
jgi:uncharacterized membrane-anchored protein